AQLGANVACIEREPALGGTCLRVGCIPTKAWVQSAHAYHDAGETFAKLGVQVGEPTLDFGTVASWKDAVVDQMTGGVASLFKANGVEWVKGTGSFKDATTLAVEGAEDVTFKSAIVATGSAPLRPPIDGIDSERCVDSTGLLAQTEVPKRIVVLGGGIIGCEFASVLQRFGSEVTIVEMLPTLVPQEDEDAARELLKQFKKRGIAVHVDSQCDRIEDTGSGLRVHFGGETVECDLMLVATGRGPVTQDIGLEALGVDFDPRKGIAADEHRRTTVPHVYAIGDCAGYWQLAHTAFREGEVAAENALGHEAVVDNRAVPRPIYTDPEIAGVGLTEREAREQHGDEVLVGTFPFSVNGRAMMQNETVGWVKSIHESRYGELLGIVMVGPHVTDLVEAGVVALDAEATVETVADGMTAHPTLSEAIKEAGLVALGRAIHLPNRKRAAARA
ncbi:MAG: dihydrolipoyl dehydrogenase, partial [Gaiellaceae bacterium]